MSDLDVKRTAIAFRIKEARKMAGLSQAQVAQMLNLHRPSISEIEAGNRRVSAEEAAKLAEVFDVRLSWLLDEDTTSVDPHAAKVQLAAREIGKLKSADLDRLLHILASLRSEEE